MALTDELKITDDKTKANQAQYVLNREVAKMAGLLSMKLDKYEYLSGEDLGHQRGVLEKVKFEYSPLGEVFDKVLKKDFKVNKANQNDNDLMYDSVHNFNKYSVSNFNKI